MKEKIEFKTETKRLLDMMINSIYTHKEIFLRELISNASDAIDKRHYLSLTNTNLASDNYEIIIEADNYGVKLYVDLLLNPKFDVRQAEAIWDCCCDEGLLSLEQIKFLAEPQNNWLKMEELARWFNDDFSIEQVREYAETPATMSFGLCSRARARTLS